MISNPPSSSLAEFFLLRHPFLVFRHLLIITALLGPVEAADFFIAPDGRDDQPGTRARPFASVQRAQAAAAAGDTVHLRGGTYRMTEPQIARKEKIWAHVTYLDKSGRPGQPITYQAVKGERPVFDLSEVKPAGKRVHAFQVTASHLHIKGIEVIGVQVTEKGHTQSICFSNTGSHNVYEQLSMHDGMGNGFYLSGGSDNLILNCDAWNNDDPFSGNKRGGNVDGFGCHPRRGGTGNIFRGCRAWFNSDDGYDCISAAESVRFENCWAFYNGFSPTFKSRGDGNGFKAGGYGIGPKARFPQSIPRHVVTRCLAVRNKQSGFYANHHPGGGDWIHNTAFRNKTNYNMLCFDLKTRQDVPGFGQVLKNNLGLEGRVEVANLGDRGNTVAGCFFGNIDGKKEFLSLREAQLTTARQANGKLPRISFLHLAPGSSLIYKGVDLGSPFSSEAPDPGAFDFDLYLYSD